MRALSVALLLTPVSLAIGQGGGVPIRIPDGTTPRCIDSKKDKIWLTLRRMVIAKNKGWFTKDNSVAAIVTASVQTDANNGKPIAFPLMTEASLEEYAVGQVSVPLEYTLVNGLTLKQTTAEYTGLGVDITLLNRKGKNKWGTALSTLNEIAKKLPIPASPIGQAGTYLIDFADKAVKKDMDGQELDDKVKGASLALVFDPTGKCSGDFESTGTIAVVQDAGLTTDAGFVDIKRPNDYCWAAEIKPAFVLKAIGKDAGVACTDARYANKHRQVTNNYVGFFLNAVTSTGVSGASPAADRRQSLDRCAANGITPQDCIP